MMTRRLMVGAVALASAAMYLAPGPAYAAAKKSYVIYLSNNFVGNDWRQQMERVAKVSVEKGPLKGRVDLHIENVENTVQAQINSLNNIIRQKPDAILVDGASATALNPTLKKACSAGIVVVSFDQTVTEPCAYAVASDWDRIPAVMAEWMADQLRRQGQRDRRPRPGRQRRYPPSSRTATRRSSRSIPASRSWDTTMASTRSDRSSPASRPCLPPIPKIDGILTQGYGSGAIQALKDAGRAVVPVTAFSYNVSAVTCVQTKGAKCILGSNPAYLSSDAIKLAVQILDTGKKPSTRSVAVKGDFLSTDPFKSKLYPNAKIVKIEIGNNAFPSQPPGLTLPITPDWVKITAAEAAGSK